MTLQGSSAAVMVLALPEYFPRNVRSLGVAIVYAVGVTIFGGTASGIATWLVSTTQSPMAPAWYVVVANVISLIAYVNIHVPRPNEAID
jgi:hypothetical protein